MAFYGTGFTTFLAPGTSGLVYLHTRNPVVVHRDIKSANVLPGWKTGAEGWVLSQWVSQQWVGRSKLEIFGGWLMPNWLVVSKILDYFSIMYGTVWDNPSH